MKDLFWFLLFATLVLSSRDLENAQENVNKSFDCLIWSEVSKIRRVRYRNRRERVRPEGQVSQNY